MAELHVEEWGSGDRTAVLIHGLSGSSRTWWQVGPELARRGYHVIAPDLAGHGRGARGTYSRERWAEDLLETLPANPDLAIGHSLGGVLLAMVVEQLRPARAVYEDPAWYPWDGVGYGEAQPAIRAAKDWTEQDLQAFFSRWSAEARSIRLEELEHWDPQTTRMNYLETAYTPVFPLVPSLVLLADPSPVIAPPLADHFTQVGFSVQTVAGTGHWLHVDDFEGFMKALEGWI